MVGPGRRGSGPELAAAEATEVLVDGEVADIGFGRVKQVEERRDSSSREILDLS